MMDMAIWAIVNVHYGHTQCVPLYGHMDFSFVNGRRPPYDDGPLAEVAYGCGRIAMFAQKAEVKNHPLEGARLT